MTVMFGVALDVNLRRQGNDDHIQFPSFLCVTREMFMN